MNDSFLINKIFPNMVNVINDQDVVGSFIAINKKWDLSSLQSILPENIIKNILGIFIPINDIDD